MSPHDGDPSLTQSLALYTDARFFTPSGTFYDSGFAVADESDSSWTRTDTAWVRSNQESLRTIVVGDFITTTLESQARAVRLGGIQVRSNFDLRPDLVTFPIPHLGGSAVVPSAVNLYINSVRQFAGGGLRRTLPHRYAARAHGRRHRPIVVRDALGREVTTNVPLYVDTRLWAEGPDRLCFRGRVVPSRLRSRVLGVFVLTRRQRLLGSRHDRCVDPRRARRGRLGPRQRWRRQSFPARTLRRAQRLGERQRRRYDGHAVRAELSSIFPPPGASTCRSSRQSTTIGISGAPRARRCIAACIAPCSACR